ncbi:hypothetical protein GS917_25240 [Rhodococcus hoagii]|uniref:hypothetical protein n=1 Tax=Rhodococcus hoagii TaxID=43767 RepID=UPI00113223B2|nr:hypothetical protein [Prescottella equi]MBM4468195.1 hypothetical protein [Prescottella equi]NKT99790.1 hypothetical protein [Prescottella equi]NKU00942.1 hypothetical protein [Prescottella equi]NKU01733.1 hypothetical protein [Prescottella equi]NKU54956.1 hypothetical protein [Prescottella equi]
MCRTHYEGWRRREMAYGRFAPDVVDVEPVRRHVEGLRRAGLSARSVADCAGVALSTVVNLRCGRSDVSRPSGTMRRPVAEKLLAVSPPSHIGLIAADSHIVDATGMVRRLQALLAAGHRKVDIAAGLGIRIDSLNRLLRGERCTARKHREVAELFAALELKPGKCERTRRSAAARGWALPLEWDEDTIDDPAAEPVRARRSARTPAASEVKRREAHELARSGMERAAIAHELGVHERTVERYLAVAS